MYCTFGSAIGRLGIETVGGRLLRLWLPGELPQDRVESEPGGAERCMIAQIGDYLGGGRRGFDFPVHEPGKTEAQRRIYRAMAAVPYGGRATYASLGPARAAGHACAANPLPLIYPCHRIVPAAGGIGQYRGGADLKKYLLDMERRADSPQAVPPDLRGELETLADPRYREFQAALIPGIDRTRMLGVRLPQLRRIARRLANGGMLSFPPVPDELFEETMIRGMLPGYAGWASLEERLDSLTLFSRRDITNWSLCDSCCATCHFVRRHREAAWEWLRQHLFDAAELPYSRRFGVVMLLYHFVPEADWARKVVEVLPCIPHGHFYVDMALAWCACELLLRHPGPASPLLTPGTLGDNVLSLTRRKLRESRRTSTADPLP